MCDGGLSGRKFQGIRDPKARAQILQLAANYELRATRSRKLNSEYEHTSRVTRGMGVTNLD